MDEKVEFVMSLGKALHRFGTNSHNLESALTRISVNLGLTAEFFSTPTVLMASFHCHDGRRNFINRVYPNSIDLRKLSLLNTLAERVIKEKISIPTATKELEKIISLKNLYPNYLDIIAYGLIGIVASIFFNGGILEALVAATTGILVGVLDVFFARRENFDNFFEFMAAFFATFFLVMLQSAYPHFSLGITVIASLIVLVPGLTLTIAVEELATYNLAAGTARMMQAILVFFKLGFGVALALQLGKLIFPIDFSLEMTSPVFPAYVKFLALFIAALGFTVLFRIQPKNYFWVLLAGYSGYFVTNQASNFLGSQLSAFLGGFVVTLIANLYARRFRQPSAMISIPGLILIVPGSLGFKGLQFLFNGNTIAGIDATFEMFLVSIAIVSGLLLANILVIPKKT